jgi:hypothetical protein
MTNSFPVPWFWASAEGGETARSVPVRGNGSNNVMRLFSTLKPEPELGSGNHE